MFARGRVLSADDITGSPEEQLAYITECLHEIDLAGKRAEDFTVLNKAVLLEVAQERELHLVAGHTNFAVWAADVLDVEPKYVFELMTDAARIRKVSELGSDLAQHLTRASARKVMAEVITSQGLEATQVIMTEGLSQATRQGKRRPTAAMLTAIAKDLAAPSIPAQEQRSEISDLPAKTSTPAEVTALMRAADALKERVYASLAPSAVRAAVEADRSSTLIQLVRLEDELQRVTKRLVAAQRSLASTPDKTAKASSS
ncbi:hypothetical protein [Streptomyces sp. NPDC012616]|uniref:hypothetical protein n=1 Tax=Streptomyces sp. NPDC012616 TaxID=3364840 RepID=UPI0036EDDEC1